MKNLVLLFLFIAFFGKSQPIILSYTPANICVGDTLCVKIYNPTHENFYFNFESTGPEPLLTWIDFYSNGIESDTMIYCIRVPDWLNCGPGFIGINLISYYPIYFKCDCGLVGIKEFSPDSDRAQSIYFNLMGIKTERVPNEILIEVKGTSRRWVRFDE